MTKEDPKQVKSVLRTKATRQLELELNFELAEDSEELSTAELKARGLLKKNKNDED